MAKFEAHITLPVMHAQAVEQLGKLTGWAFSRIDGDPLLGAKPYCYLTAYRPSGDELLAEMRAVSIQLHDAGIEVLREKVERIVYDTKTGVDEIGFEACRRQTRPVDKA